jgi:hypothetical protein
MTPPFSEPIQLWFVLIFWSAEVMAAALLAYLLFCKRTYYVTREGLTMEANILGIRW